MEEEGDKKREVLVVNLSGGILNEQFAHKEMVFGCAQLKSILDQVDGLVVRLGRFNAEGKQPKLIVIPTGVPKTLDTQIDLDTFVTKKLVAKQRLQYRTAMIQFYETKQKRKRTFPFLNAFVLSHIVPAALKDVRGVPEKYTAYVVELLQLQEEEHLDLKDVLARTCPLPVFLKGGESAIREQIKSEITMRMIDDLELALKADRLDFVPYGESVDQLSDDPDSFFIEKKNKKKHNRLKKRGSDEFNDILKDEQDYLAS